MEIITKKSRQKNSSIDTSKIAVIGAGQFGSAMCHYLDAKGFQVSAYDANIEGIKYLCENRSPRGYPKVSFSHNVSFTNDISAAVENAGIIFMAVPSQYYRDAARNLNDYITENSVIVNLTKGMEIGTSKLMSQIIKEEIHKKYRYAALAGGMYAREVLNDKLVYADIAAHDKSLAKDLRELSSRRLFLRSSDNVLGVEIAGPLKNIGAIIVGMADKLEVGHSGYCGFMCEYEEEAIRIANHLSPNKRQQKNFTELFAWRGDTMTTWFDKESRNRQFGEKIILSITEHKTAQTRKKVIEELIIQEETNSTVEGYHAAKAMYQIAKNAPHKYPILCGIYRTLYEGSSPEEEIEKLIKIFLSKVEKAAKFSLF